MNTQTNPKIGVEVAENGTFRASLRHPVTNELLRLCDKRQSYGEAFEQAHKMAMGEA